MSNPVIVIVGAGPGVGAAVARRFGRAGYDVALIARSQAKLEQLGMTLQDEGITAGWTAVDISDRDGLTAAIGRFGTHVGHIDALHFNPSVTRLKGPLELTADELLADVDVGVASLLTAVQAAAPSMPAGARLLVTGSISADRPWVEAASLGVQKAGVRNLVLALDSALAERGVRAMVLTVAGVLAAGTPFAPDHVADALFAAAETADSDWRPEVVFTGA